MKVDLSRSRRCIPTHTGQVQIMEVGDIHTSSSGTQISLLLQRFRMPTVPVMYDNCIKFSFSYRLLFGESTQQFSGGTPHIITRTSRVH